MYPCCAISASTVFRRSRARSGNLRRARSSPAPFGIAASVAASASVSFDGALPEVMARRCLDSVPSVREADLIEICLEDLLLVVVLLHLARGLLLAELATRLMSRRSTMSGCMLPTSCCVMVLAPPSRLAEDLAFDRAGDADDVDAVMLVEALVFDRNECLRDVARERANRDAAAELDPDFADERAVARENLRRLRRLDYAPTLRFCGLRCRRNRQ